MFWPATYTKTLNVLKSSLEAERFEARLLHLVAHVKVDLLVELQFVDL